MQRTFRAMLSLRRQLQLAKANGDAQGASSVSILLRCSVIYHVLRFVVARISWFVAVRPTLDEKSFVP